MRTTMYLVCMATAIIYSSCEGVFNSSYFDYINTVQDFDGNIYHIVNIGDKFWFVENLHVKHFSNGDEIPMITDSTAWSNLNTGEVDPTSCTTSWLI